MAGQIYIYLQSEGQAIAEKIVKLVKLFLGDFFL